ncbi:MAG: hypothetical protein U9O06_06550 [Euryarchaeota archaeon]|nr:hypothetical protein [Euryarchaeota archaeon]
MSPAGVSAGLVAQLGGVQWLVDALGVEGVSAAALALVGVALYVHRAAAVGSTAVGVASTGATTAKVTAGLLAVLVGLGVLSVNYGRGAEVVSTAWTWIGNQGASWIGRLIGTVAA